MATNIQEFYDVTFAHYGDLKWWPAQSPFEIAVGAILTQNTSWKNVEKAIKRLQDEKRLTPQGILRTPQYALAESIKSTGYFNQKALRLRAFVEWFDDELDCDFSVPESLSTAELREKLLSLKGIGPETADDILLYSFRRPVFVVDAYTYRIAVRHGWVAPEVSYDELSETLRSNLEEDIFTYQNFHAILVEIGKNFCEKKSPKCELCPAGKCPGFEGPLEMHS